MWLDERPGDDPFAPLTPVDAPGARVGFADWYLEWLEGCEDSVGAGRERWWWYRDAPSPEP